MQASNVLRAIPVLYHFTDTRNLPSIHALGALFPLAMLRQHNIAIPAEFGPTTAWKTELARELRHAGIAFDANKVF